MPFLRVRVLRRLCGPSLACAHPRVLPAGLRGMAALSEAAFPLIQSGPCSWTPAPCCRGCCGGRGTRRGGGQGPCAQEADPQEGGGHGEPGSEHREDHRLTSTPAPPGGLAELKLGACSSEDAVLAGNRHRRCWARQGQLRVWDSGLSSPLTGSTLLAQVGPLGLWGRLPAVSRPSSCSLSMDPFIPLSERSGCCGKAE